MRLEDLRHQEVHQTPQLHQVVLQRSPGKQQPAFDLEGQQACPPLRLEVLNMVCLVEYHVLEPVAFEYLVILQNQFITGDDDVHSVGFGPAQPLGLALLDAALLVDDFEGRTPLFDFHLPLVHDGGRHHDQVRAPDALCARQVCQQRHGLHGLAQAHFVGQYAVDFPVVQCHQPLQADQLLFTQVMFQNVGLANHRFVFLQSCASGLDRFQVGREVFNVVFVEVHLRLFADVALVYVVGLYVEFHSPCI